LSQLRDRDFGTNSLTLINVNESFEFESDNETAETLHLPMKEKLDSAIYEELNSKPRTMKLSKVGFSHDGLIRR
jgi:hypothetical protein